MKSNVTCTQSKEPSLLLGVCSFGCPLAQGEQHSLIEDVGDVIGRKAAVFGLSGGCEGGGGGGGGDEKGVPHLRGKGTVHRGIYLLSPRVWQDIRNLYSILSCTV